jgi:hypothetical protein
MASVSEPPTATDWQAQAVGGLDFGVDRLFLSSPRGKVDVLSVSPINPTGGMQVLDVAFVPNGEVGGATPAKEGIVTTLPVWQLWRAESRRRLIHHAAHRNTGGLHGWLQGHDVGARGDRAGSDSLIQRRGRGRSSDL